MEVGKINTQEYPLFKKIKYKFRNISLYERALLHSSADRGYSNERLEFLGDAVLELIISEYLFNNKKKYPEGKLTKTRAAIVTESSLVLVANQLGLSPYLILGKSEENSGGREKPSILADAVEALIGAVYLDGGYKNAKKVVLGLLKDNIESVLKGGGFKDYKTKLQEYYHQKKITDVSYKTYDQKGPPHNRTFYVRLVCNGETIAKGSGKTKKSAEQDAAKKAVKKLNL